jgi:hypothetical protein
MFDGCNENKVKMIKVKMISTVRSRQNEENYKPAHGKGTLTENFSMV